MFRKFDNNFRFIGEEGASTGKKYEFTDAPTWIIGSFYVSQLILSI